MNKEFRRYFRIVILLERLLRLATITQISISRNGQLNCTINDASIRDMHDRFE